MILSEDEPGASVEVEVGIRKMVDFLGDCPFATQVVGYGQIGRAESLDQAANLF